MRSGRILILFGLVLAVGAAALSFFILQNADTGQDEAEVERRRVVVALQPIEARNRIPPDAVRVEEWPTSIAPSDALTSTEQVANQLAIGPIFPGQVLLESMIIDRLEMTQQLTGSVSSDVSFAIPEGRVLVAFPVSSIGSVAGAIEAGDTVDLMVTIELPEDVVGEAEGETEEAAADTSDSVVGFTLQNLEVLRTRPWGAEGGEDGGGGNVYTLLVDRQQALILKYIHESAQPDFALRPADDDEQYDTEPVNLNFLITEFDLEPAQP